jgi:hypothetical protein
MEKKQMEKKETERELSKLMSMTLAWEDELNSIIRMEEK